MRVINLAVQFIASTRKQMKMKMFETGGGYFDGDVGTRMISEI